MCSLSVNASGDLDFGCTCDEHCQARHGTEHVQLDDNRLPFTFSVAVDWVHGLYYWAGHSYDVGAIGVYEVATKRRRVLFNGQSFEPLDIEVDPIAGYIFWVDYKRNSVFRANTDGRNWTNIMNLIGVRSIALDVNARRIYFVDSVIRHIIASADYSGKDVITVLHHSQFVSSFTPALLVLDDDVFWAEDYTLLSVSKHGNGALPK
ncbi:Protein T13C2.6 a, partial [Aphelenchoides avenae]